MCATLGKYSTKKWDLLAVASSEGVEANIQSALRVSVTASIGRSVRNSEGSEAALRVALTSRYGLHLGRGGSEA